MPEYLWRAIDATGTRSRGQSEAADEQALEQQLNASDLALVSARLVRQTPIGMGLLRARCRSRIGPTPLMSFSFACSVMLKAGVPLIESLRDLAQTQAHPAMREVVRAMAASIAAGKTFSEAMREHPHVFDAVYISLIHAGEASGKLTEVLQTLTHTLQWQHDVRAQTQKALIYPAFVFVVITAVLWFMLTQVVPQIAQTLKLMRMALPWQTQVILSLSDFVRTHGMRLSIGVLGMGIAGWLLLRLSPAVRLRLDRLKLALPLIGGVLQKIDLARFAYVLSLLYVAGMTVTEALVLVEKSLGNRAMAQAVAHARGEIALGKRLSEAFVGHALFAPTILSMLRVGETTGSLDQTLHYVSTLYTQEAKAAIDKLQASLQPLLTIGLGASLALIVVFTLGPLYESLITGVRF